MEIIDAILNLILPYIAEIGAAIVGGALLALTRFLRSVKNGAKKKLSPAVETLKAEVERQRDKSRISSKLAKALLDALDQAPRNLDQMSREALDGLEEFALQLQRKRVERELRDRVRQGEERYKKTSGSV